MLRFKIHIYPYGDVELHLDANDILEERPMVLWDPRRNAPLNDSVELGRIARLGYERGRTVGNPTSILKLVLALRALSADSHYHPFMLEGHDYDALVDAHQVEIREARKRRREERRQLNPGETILD